MRNKNLIGKLVLGFSLTFSLAYSTSEARGSNGDRGRASDRRDQRGGYDQRLETQQYAGRCIGGKKCGGSRNQLSIDLPTDVNVQRIEIFADDLVGSVHRGSLNVYLDGRLLGQALDVSPDSGKLFSFNVKSRNSAQLLVAANANDEVNVQWVKVYYSRENNGGHYDPGHGGGYYPGYGSSRLDFQGGCIGGEKCPGRLSELYLPVTNNYRPVYVDGVEFIANDHVGSSHNGVVNIYLDNQLIVSNVSIGNRDERYQFSIRRYGRVLRIVAVSNDEVQVKNVSVYVGDR